MTSQRRLFLSLVLVGMVAVCRSTLGQDVLLEDEFEFFELGETWQEHAEGAPDVTLEVGFSDDSDVLQMVTSPFEDAFYGIETITPISLMGLADVTVDARLRPINQGVEGSVAAAEVALIGASGEVIRAFASNNAGPDPESANDWADHYEDSKGNIDTSGPWPHCTDKGGPACDAMRNLVVTVTTAGTTLQAFDDNNDPDFPRWETSFDDLTLADLGGSLTVALRQLAVENGDNVAGFFDSVLVATSGAVVIRGDYDGNGILGAADVDLQAVAMKDPLPDLAAFDENGDGAVDQADRKIWINDHARTWSGDSNLDGEFNSGDLVAVFTAGKYEAEEMAGWAEGDWNGDMTFDSGDLVTAFTEGGYEQGPQPQAAAVPEPGSMSPLIFAGLIMAFRPRRTVATQ